MLTRLAAGLGLVALLAGGCTSAEEPAADPQASEPSAEPSESPTASTSPAPKKAPTLAPEDRLPPVRHPVSLPALMRQEPDGGRPRMIGTEATTDAYTRYRVTYRSGDLTVSGVLLRPRGDGPFPAIVLNHGYIEPALYETGQGLAREQDALARAGFVVLHTDYRGHAGSDPVPPLSLETRLGYARDAINAVDALTKLPYVDDRRLAMLGRSMGGGVTMNALVAQPGLVDAAVIYASVSSRFLDNVNHFTRPNRPDAVRTLFDRFGTPAEDPRFYRDLSPRSYFDRITEPVLAHHGRVDATCPPRWAAETQRLMRQAGVDSRLRWYPGEDHTFYARWQQSMDRTIAFLREEFRRSSARGRPAGLELTVPDDAPTRCMVPNASLLGRAEVAFDAEVVSVADGKVTLEPTRWYAGTPVDRVTVRQSSTSMRDLVGAVRFRGGRRYLVAANHGAVMVCGFSGEHDAELEALYTEAFVDQAE